MLRTLSEKKKYQFYKQFLGESRIVLLEAEQKGDFMHGFTDNYIKVTVPYNENQVNAIMPVKLVDFDEAGNVLATVLHHSLA